MFLQVLIAALIIDIFFTQNVQKKRYLVGYKLLKGVFQQYFIQREQLVIQYIAKYD